MTIVFPFLSHCDKVRRRRHEGSYVFYDRVSSFSFPIKKPQVGPQAETDCHYVVKWGNKGGGGGNRASPRFLWTPPLKKKFERNAFLRRRYRRNVPLRGILEKLLPVSTQKHLWYIIIKRKSYNLFLLISVTIFWRVLEIGLRHFSISDFIIFIKFQKGTKFFF